MQFQKLFFENAQGVKLTGLMDMPLDEKPVAYAIFAHCFTCTKNFNTAVNISRALSAEGIAVLRFDFTGLGESEGDFSETNLSSNVSDLVAAADFLGANFQAPKLLIGHSLGGAAVLLAASHIPSAVGITTIGAPFNLARITRALNRSKEEMETKGAVEITIEGKKILIKKQFVDDLDNTDMEDAVRNLRRALLVLHSPRDAVVPLENAAQIFQAARHPKSFISLDRADHLLSDRNDSMYVGLLMAAWAGKYLGVPFEKTPPRELEDNRIVVRTGKKGYQTEIIANGHRLIADEPIAVGGANTGPTPYDYLVTALGSCTAMTLRMYADQKGWPLDEVVVRLKHGKIHAQDCEQCESKMGKIDFIEREIDLGGGPFTAEQRKRLLEIADRCPVHRTLHSEIIVKSSLKEEPAD
ncbi:MAG: alpha/beta fold hydrolase [Syntrophobacteraceae bacterium]